MLDPYTATREQFTQAVLQKPCPENAKKQYKHMRDNLVELYEKLAHHEAMRPNINQTYMTPAASKNKIYFMWDFVGRTIAMQDALDPRLLASQKQAWLDVCSRAKTAEMMICDTTGKLERMNAAVGYKDDQGVEFDDDLKRLATEAARSDI